MRSVNRLIAVLPLAMSGLAAEADLLRFNFETPIGETTFSIDDHPKVSTVLGLNGISGFQTDGVVQVCTTFYASYPTPCFLSPIRFSVDGGREGVWLDSGDIVFTTPVLFTGFPDAPVLQRGVYSVTQLPDSPGTLTVSIAPEPSSIALLSTGILGLGAVVRRRLIYCR